VVTTSRADFGLLRELMHVIDSDRALELQVIVSGMHLARQFGQTWRDIEAEGIRIDRKIPMRTIGLSSAGNATSIGQGLKGFADAFAELKPQVVVLLGDRFELLWEFPGGKKKPGETSREALARELIEELGVEAKIGREVHRVQHKYAEMSEPIELIFFAASVDAGAVKNLVFEQIQWREPGTLGELEFLPADQPLVEQLANGEVDLNPNLNHTHPPIALTKRN